MPTRNNERRAVISGVGLITPLGTSKAQVWKNWAAGHCAAALVRQFDVSTLPSRIASEVADFVPQQHIKNRKLLKLLRRGEDFAIAAAKAALEDAQVRPAGLDSARCGVAVGCSKEGPPVENFFAGIEVALDAAGQIDRARFADEGLPLIPPLTIIEGLPNACLYYLVESFHLEGANHNFLTYGAGAALALGEAFRSIQRGDADQMLAGGFDSWVNWVSLSFLAEMGLLTRANERPQQAHRPFDAARSGSVAGEGAGFTVLEDREHARRRGAAAHGEILAYRCLTALNTEPENNAKRPSEGNPLLPGGGGLGWRDATLQEGTSVTPKGDVESGPSLQSAAPADVVAMLADGIAAALDEAGCKPADIDLIHLNGDATLEGDRWEALAVRKALGCYAQRVPVTTIKSATGHLGNAAATVELAAVLETLRRGTLLPILNLTHPDPELPLAYVRTAAEGLPLRRVLLINRGWPATFTVLVLQRVDG